MKIWTVSNESENGNTVYVYCTETEAEAACLSIVRENWSQWNEEDHGPMPEDWREAYDLTEDTRDWWLTLDEHDISAHPDLAVKEVSA